MKTSTKMKVLLCLLCLIFVHQSNAQVEVELYEQYHKALSEKNFKKAKKKLLKISKVTSNKLVFTTTKAIFFGKSNELDSAKAYLELALEIQSEDPILFSSKNFNLLNDSLYPEAIRVYDKIIDNEPIPDHYHNRGAFKSHIQLNEEALVDFNKAIEIDPRSIRSHYSKGLMLRRLHDVEGALDAYDVCIELDPNFGDAFLNKGFALMYLDEFDQAIECFEESIELATNVKDVSFALNNIGYCFYKIERNDKSREYINESIKLNPINSFAYRNLALLEISENNLNNACKAMDKSLELGFTENYGNEVIELKLKYCSGESK